MSFGRPVVSFKDKFKASFAQIEESPRMPKNPRLKTAEMKTGKKKSSAEPNLYMVDRVIDNVSAGLEALITPTRPLSRSKQNLLSAYLRGYIERILYITKMNAECLVLALIYLQKIKHKLTITENNVRELFVASALLGSKYLEEETYNNKDWAAISGFMSPSEISQLETYLLGLLDYSLHVERRQYMDYMFAPKAAERPSTSLAQDDDAMNITM